MTLQEWVEREGKGAIARLSRESGIAYPTVHKICSGHIPGLPTIKRLCQVTGGEVTANDFMGQVHESNVAAEAAAGEGV